MPFIDDHSIVSCAADGQVRHSQLQEGGCVDTEYVVIGSDCGRIFI